MNRMLTATLFALGAIAAGGLVSAQAQTRGASSPSIRDLSSDDWSRITAHLPRCETSSQPSLDDGLVLLTWKVDSLEGTIALPRGFRQLAKPGSASRDIAWAGPDSSRIALSGIESMGGLAMSGGKIVHGVSTCAAQLFGRKVPASEFEMVIVSNKDTTFVSIPSTIVRKGQGVQVTIEARSSERRAKLLEYAESMQLANRAAGH